MTRPPIYRYLPIILLILLVDSSILLFHPAANDKLLAYAVLFDLVIVVPLLYVWFFVRSGAKPLWTVLPLPLIGSVLAWVLLPQEHKAIALQAELFLLPIEAGLLLFEGRLLIKAFRSYRMLRHTEQDRFEALRIIVQQKLGKGKAASLFLHDLTALMAITGSWGARARAERQRIADVATSGASDSDGAAFTYHRESSRVVYAALFTKILLIEGFLVHLLVMQWSTLAAWILTLLDVWLLFYIWADCRLSLIRPIRLTNHTLHLRCGLQMQADIPLASIESIQYAMSFEIPKEEQPTSASLAGSANIRIKLSEAMPITGMLFMPLKASTIYLTMDQPKPFISAVEARQNHLFTSTKQD